MPHGVASTDTNRSGVVGHAAPTKGACIKNEVNMFNKEEHQANRAIWLNLEMMPRRCLSMVERLVISARSGGNSP